MSVRFTGLPGEIEEVTLTDEEKLACVKSVLEERFSRPIQSGSYFGLTTIITRTMFTSTTKK